MLPVVLHHGLFGHGNIQLGRVKISYFKKIDRAIVERGHPLIVTRVHPSSSIENRARQLKENVLRQLAILGRLNEKVILIGHSMGGLDARYAVAKLGMAEHVAAVVTVATPHRGSPYADWVVENLGRKLGGIKLVSFLKLDLTALLDLTTERCATFNDDVKDDPNVKYFSISTARAWQQTSLFGILSNRLIAASEGENDGRVSVKSSTWGTHLGTWPADHWHAINRRFRIESKVPTGDIVPYWLRMLDSVVSEIDKENV